MRPVSFALLTTILICTAAADTTGSGHFMIVQISPVIDGKAAKPTNFTIPLNNTSPLSHTLSISSINLLKNVSMGLQLFAWYNGDWIAKKPRTIQITQRRRVYSALQRNLLSFIKYADLNNINSKQPVVLNHTAVYISYDPMGSLMTAQLEQPTLFIPPSTYLPVAAINKTIQRINSTLQFRIVHKTDQFIENKRALSDLLQIQAKSSQLFPIIAVPFAKDLVQPTQILQTIRKNLVALGGQERKVGEKLQLISRYGYQPLLTKHIYKLDTLQDYLPIYYYLSKFKLTLRDTLGPIWQWIFAQPFILADITTLQSAFLSQTDELVHRNILKQLSDAARMQQNILWAVFAIWIVLDVFSYWLYSRNLGISTSHGTFLNVLLITHLLAVSLRTAMASVWYLGLLVLLIGLVLHLCACHLIESRVSKYKHAGTNSDALLTSLIKNTLILLVMINICMHLLGKSGITLASLWVQGMQVLNRLQASPVLSILWSFSQFNALMSQYYYVLVMIPQIILNCRLRSVQNTTLLRIVLLVGLCYGQYGLIRLSNEPVELVFRFKQGILAAILVCEWILFHKNRAQALPQQSSQSTQPQQSKQQLQSSQQQASHEQSVQKQ